MNLMILCLAILFVVGEASAFLDFLRPDVSEKDVDKSEAEARILFNATTFNNVTNLAMYSGALLFVGLNTAFAYAVFRPGQKKRHQNEKHERR